MRTSPSTRWEIETAEASFAPPLTPAEITPSSRAAAAGRRLAAVRDRLRGRRVGDVAPPVLEVPTGAPLAWAVEALVRRGGTDVVGVTGPEGIVGALTIDDLREMPAEERSLHAVQEVMTPIAALPAVQAAAPATRLLPLLGRQPVAVLEGARLRSLVTGRQLEATLAWAHPRPRAPEGWTADERLDGARRTHGRGHGRPSPPSGRTDRRRAGSALRTGLLAASGAVVLAAIGVVPMPLVEVSPGPALDGARPAPHQGEHDAEHLEACVVPARQLELGEDPAEPVDAGVVRRGGDEHEATHAQRRPADRPVARWQVAEDEVVGGSERPDHLGEAAVAGRARAGDLDAELVGEPGHLRPAGDDVETPSVRVVSPRAPRAPGCVQRAHRLDDRELLVQQHGGEERLAAVGTIEVAEVPGQVALGVEVDRKHRPASLGGQPGEVRHQARLADAALAVRDEEHVVEHDVSVRVYGSGSACGAHMYGRARAGVRCQAAR